MIISHHVLEHLLHPASVLDNLKKKLVNGGCIICVIPIDDWKKQKYFDPNDINKHLYTWTPLLIGNLFELCGYKEIEVKVISRMWLPLSRFYYNYIPKNIYIPLSYLWSLITRSRQIRIIAKKK